MKFMGKEEFIEEMKAAREEEEEEKEYINMADVAKVSEEVKTAVQAGTGKQITRLAEPTKRRGRKPGSRNKAKTETASWQRHIKDSIKALASEGEVKIEQIKNSVEKIETLMLQIEVLDDKIRETEEALKDMNNLMERIQTLEDMIK